MNELGLPSSFGPQQRFTKSNKKSNNHNFTHHVDVEVEEVFKKMYSFLSNKNARIKSICKLPDPASLFTEDTWKLDDFQELKRKLNDTKSKLNDLNLKQWHLHTTNTNTAGEVMKKLRYSVYPEFLTQAWCKMYECLMTTAGLVPKKFKNGVFNSVHLCEAPGAFITSLHHFLQTWNQEIKWDWLATTLNPYHESNPLSHMIQDDRFILHTLPKWTFGEDCTGNLMDKDNLQHLQDQVQSRFEGNVMLVTADGSIDCQVNPAEQEALVSPLHFCETISALNILDTDGSFVLKMFTLLECESICLLYLLVCVFNTVTVFKPVKSKEGNSEVYVLCTGYVGKDQLAPWMPVFKEQFGPSVTKAMFSNKDIPEEFIGQVYECAKMFADFQMGVIERNLDLFFHPTPQKQTHTKMVKRRVAEKYLVHYILQPIETVIVGNETLADTPSFNLAQKVEEGTFNDRLRKVCQDKSQQIEQLLAGLQDLGCRWPFSESICWFMFNSFKLPSIKVISGQPVTTVLSSKFCHGRILQAFSQVHSARLITSEHTEVSTSETVDVSQFPWESENSKCHLLLVEQVSAKLKDLPATRSLCIQGLPLLTQFTVAVVFLLAHSFYQVGLSSSGNVILCGYQQALSPVSWLQDVITEMHRLQGSKAVLSILPISLLCDKLYCMESGVSFYVCVSSINNTRLLQSLEAEAHKIHPVNSV